MPAMATPRRQKRHAGLRARGGRTLASTILLYASFLVLVLAMLLVWEWYKKRDAPPKEPAPPPSARAGPLAPPTRPAGPTTRAGAASAPATSAPAGPDEPGDNLSPSAIELNENERIAFGDVQDGIGKLDETAFYMLLGRADKMPRLSGDDFDALPRPGTGNILKQPSLFRAQAMRIKLRVSRYTAGKEISYSRHWPKDRPLWRIHGLDLVPLRQTPHPLIVFLLQDPRPLLGEPDKVNVSGDLEYHKLKSRLDLAGIFYKVYSSKDRKGQRRDYPVFVAWQAADTTTRSAPRFGSLPMLLIGILVALLVAFLILKRYLRQTRKIDAEPFVRYRPLRDRPSGASDAPAPADEKPPDAEAEAREAEGVDPLLKQAAEEYQREQQERQQDDGTNGRS